MVIKGKSCGGAGRLAVHLLRTDTNERAEVLESKGVAATDLRGALHEMEALAAGTRSSKPFYHASVNTLAHERLTPEQRIQAIDRLEKELGLAGQPRVVVLHEKAGREHCHIVWSRIDLERMAAISDSHNYRKHELVARELEREFGLERVQGVHIERDGKPRPERTPSHAEMLQAERTGITPQEVKRRVTDIWQATTTGREFAEELERAGFVLARGDRRDFVIIDQAGGIHSLARRIEGANAKAVRERLSDLDRDQIPSIKEAKQIQKAHEPVRDRGQDRGFGAHGIEPTETGGRSRRGGRGERPIEGGVRAVGRALDGIASTFECLLGGAPEPPKPPTSQELAAADQRAVAAEMGAAHEKIARQSEDDVTKRRQELARKYGHPEPGDILRSDYDHDFERDRTRGI